MKTVSIHDAKTNLSKYIAAAKNGEKVYIGSFGKTEVVLTKVPAEDSAPKSRDFSIAKGKLTASADAFSASTDKQITKLLLGD